MYTSSLVVFSILVLKVYFCSCFCYNKLAFEDEAEFPTFLPNVFSSVLQTITSQHLDDTILGLLHTEIQKNKTIQFS